MGAEKGLRDLGPKETQADLYFRKNFEERVERAGPWGRGETEVRDGVEAMVSVLWRGGEGTRGQVSPDVRKIRSLGLGRPPDAVPRERAAAWGPVWLAAWLVHRGCGWDLH